MALDLRLPLALVATLALAACETAGGPTPTTAAAPTASGAGTTAAAGSTGAQPATAPSGGAAAGANAPTPAEQQAWEQVVNQVAPQLNPCLQAVYDADESRKVGEIQAIAEFEQDGTLRGIQVANADRIEADADYRFVVETMLRGIQECSPLEGMAASNYEYWEFFPIIYRSAPA
ncbi:MAG: hypothetical protein AAFX81_10650 [Pseudomonadota bacterium]